MLCRSEDWQPFYIIILRAAILRTWTGSKSLYRSRAIITTRLEFYSYYRSRSPLYLYPRERERSFSSVDRRGDFDRRAPHPKTLARAAVVPSRSSRTSPRGKGQRPRVSPLVHNIHNM